MRLLPRDYDLTLATVAEINSWRTLASFTEAVFPILGRAIISDYITWVTYDLAPRIKLTRLEESEKRSTPELIAISEQGLPHHPITQYFLRTGDSSAQILADYCKPQEIAGHPHLRTLRKLEVSRALITGIHLGPTQVAALSFADRTRDFTERDRLVLNLLRPHLLQARANAERLSRLEGSGVPAKLPEQRERLAGLTRREGEVAQWLAHGKTNLEIGVLLGASSRTIEKHVQRVLEKLGVENRTTAAVLINNVCSLERLLSPSCPANRGVLNTER